MFSRLGLVRLGLVRLGLASLGLVRLGLVRLGLVRLGYKLMVVITNNFRLFPVIGVNSLETFECNSLVLTKNWPCWSFERVSFGLREVFKRMQLLNKLRLENETAEQQL